LISALPLGGYVRLLDEREMPVQPQDRHMALGSKPLWARALIVAAGPAANFLLAIALFSVVHWVGTQEQKALLGTPPVGSVAHRAGVHAGDWVREASVDADNWTPVMSMESLRWQLMQAALQAQPLHLRVSDARGLGMRTLFLDLSGFDEPERGASLMNQLGLHAWRDALVFAVLPAGPAAEAGLQAGDRILRVGDVPVVDAAHLEAMIRAHGANAGPMVWHALRGLQNLTLHVTPVFDQQAQSARVRVQLGGAPEFVTVRYGLIEGLAQAIEDTWVQSAITLKMLARILIGEASIKNISGVVSIADHAGQSARIGWLAYLGFLAALSVGLAVLNLLPLPMLDGGHLMYYLFEALTGRPLPEFWLDRLQRFGLAFLVLLMLLALFNDLNRLWGLS
jgi:regulator of sigma E protease